MPSIKGRESMARTENAAMQIIMMGTGTFADPTFVALLAGPHPVVGLVTQPDRPVGEERGSTRQTGRGMKTLAVERNVQVFQPEKINTPEGVAYLQSLKPDLLVVAAYGQILSNEVLSAARLGGINVHASLLPKYRGAAPVAWAIYHGEAESGVTIIRMTTGLDAGDVLAQEKLTIGPAETAGDLEVRLAPLGARLAMQVIELLARGSVTGAKQDRSLVTKAPKLTKELGLIDWARTAPEVCNQVRAMQPWPTAYTWWHRQGTPAMRLMIGRCKALPNDLAGVKPGACVIRSSEPTLSVASGKGIVEILELQPSGKKRMAANEFLRGNSVREGDWFGAEKE
jgi:methionyl-tRNA formyltransferase